MATLVREDRLYQREAWTAIEKHLREKQPRQLIVLPTGAGKTDVAVGCRKQPWWHLWVTGKRGNADKLLTAAGFTSGKIFFLVHREEIVRQTADRYKMYYPGANVQIEMANLYADEDAADIIVASVQTVTASNDERLKRFDPAKFSQIVFDEAHHAAAPSYIRVAQHFRILPPDNYMPFRPNADTIELMKTVGRLRKAKKRRAVSAVNGHATYTKDEKETLRAARKQIGAAKIDHQRTRLAQWDTEHWSEHRMLLGLTATPRRPDKIGMENIFGRIVYSKSMLDLINDGFLAAPRAYRVETDTSLDDIGTTSDGRGESDFNIQELAKAINNERRNKQIFDAYIQYGEMRKAIGFAADVKHAHDMADLFNANGIPARAVDGTVSKRERAEIFEDYRNNVFKVLFNCMVATEGFDEPSIACVLLARATKSSVVYTQQAGRGLRKFPGKTDCILIDFVDVCRKHRLVTAPTLLGLPPDFNGKGQPLNQIAGMLNKAKEEFPFMNIDDLHSIEDLKIRAHEVDVFEPFHDEIANTLSKNAWMRMNENEFQISFNGQMSSTDSVHIGVNADGDWEVNFIEYGAGRPLQTAGSLEQAFKFADGWIKAKRPDVAAFLRRDAAWRQKDASAAQKRRITRALKQQGITSIDPDKMSMGDASLVIGAIDSGLIKKVKAK